MTNYPNNYDDGTTLPPVTPDTGPIPGPPGPAGPAGPAGPQGPIGARGATGGDLKG